MSISVRTWILDRLHAQDERVLGYVVGRRHPRLDAVMSRITHLGDASVVIAVCALLLLAPSPAVREAGVRAGLALTVSHILVQILKRTIARDRPRLPMGILSMIQAPDRFSFPSGHAAAGLAVGAGIALSLPLVLGGPLILLGFLVGVTRCYLGVHYPGDVLAGWVLALVGLLLAA